MKENETLELNINFASKKLYSYISFLIFYFLQKLYKFTLMNSDLLPFLSIFNLQFDPCNLNSYNVGFVHELI